MLTEEQIQQLFRFCQKHHVHHYDVQVELVDHLANAIEERMAQNKQLDFSAALESVYTGFGIMGFAKVVSSKAEALSKQYSKMNRQLFLSYFTWPKAAMFFCIYLALTFVRNYLSVDQLEITTYSSCAFLVLFNLNVYWQIRRMRKKLVQKMLLAEAGDGVTIFIGFFPLQLVYFTFNHSTFNIADSQNSIIAYQLAVLVLLLTFISILAYRELWKKIIEKIVCEFPEVMPKGEKVMA